MLSRFGSCSRALPHGAEWNGMKLPEASWRLFSALIMCAALSSAATAQTMRAEAQAQTVLRRLRYLFSRVSAANRGSARRAVSSRGAHRGSRASQYQVRHGGSGCADDPSARIPRRNSFRSASSLSIQGTGETFARHIADTKRLYLYRKNQNSVSVSDTRRQIWISAVGYEAQVRLQTARADRLRGPLSPSCDSVRWCTYCLCAM